MFKVALTLATQREGGLGGWGVFNTFFFICVSNRYIKKTFIFKTLIDFNLHLNSKTQLIKYDHYHMRCLFAFYFFMLHSASQKEQNTIIMQYKQNKFKQR